MSTAAEELLWELGELHRRLREAVQEMSPADLDRVPADGANSIAVLVTHTIGSEIGWLHLAAGRPHQRDRASEFTVRGRAGDDLIRAIAEAERVAPDLVRGAYAAGLETQRERPGARPVTVGYCLTHAAAHTAEHVGHVELTRQVLGSGPVAPR